jgi:hypothetical protein
MDRSFPRGIGKCELKESAGTRKTEHSEGRGLLCIPEQNWVSHGSCPQMADHEYSFNRGIQRSGPKSYAVMRGKLPTL